MRVPTRPPARTAAPSTDTHPPAAPVTELDVRDDLRNRREPFSRIMAAADSLPGDGVLHLRATFEPVPLFTVLGRQGFVHETQQHAEDDWSVWFWRGTPTPSAASGRPAPAATSTRTATTKPDDTAAETQLDVRDLEPPEPMVRTLAALESLAPGQTLVQVNVRVPQFLLPILTERGFVYEIDESAADRVLVRIRRGA